MSCTINFTKRSFERRFEERSGYRSMATSDRAKSNAACIASRVLILNCDPSAPDIKEMAGQIEFKEIQSGNRCRTIDSLLELRSLTEIFDKLIIASHHSFYTKDECVSVKSIGMRKLGDFDLSSIAEIISNLITKHKVFDVQFYACEFALSESTRHMGVSDSTLIGSSCPLLSKPFFESDSSRIDELCESGRDSQVSSLEYITSHVCRSLITTYNNKEVKLRGLTGMGYIDSRDLIPKSFDQEHYKEYLDIKKIEKLLSKQKSRSAIERLSSEIELKKNKFEKNVDNFDSPHQVELVINSGD